MRDLLASTILGAGLVAVGLVMSGPVQAQSLSPLGVGFTSAPSFSWFDPDPARDGGRDGPRWDGSYARLSSGFEVLSSKRFGTTAGPTIGFEGGQLRRDGDFVYGIVGAFDYLQPIGGDALPRFGRVAYTRDFAGAVQFKAGAFVAENVLVYTKLGAAAVNETFRFGPSAASLPFSRNDIAFGPDARVGVEWALTDKLSVSLEAGVNRQGFR